jgi:catechol 2,3-dioxygenase-like lactoylglutathione lyase family enzyme
MRMGTQTPALRVQHVSIPRPIGSSETARRFYAGVLGLEEVPPPASLAHLDLVWYRLGETELHLIGVQGDHEPQLGHFCIQVDDLQVVRARLAQAHAPIDEDQAIPNRPRFFTRDPFGNRIEITTILGPYV